MENHGKDQSVVEEIKTTGEELLSKIKAIVKEGNARRIAIKDKDGKEIIAFPLTIGVVGVALLPVFAAVGAIAALVSDCTIEVER